MSKNRVTIKLIFLATTLSLFGLINTTAQEITWKAGYHSFFDNREYFNNYAAPGSALGSRIFAEGGIALDERNTFSIGLDFMYEYGDEIRSEYINPTLYFHHIGSEAEFYMGAFSRKGLIDLPMAMLSDTLNYYRPNVEGIYIKFHKPWGKQEVWLDWTSRQTMEARETFLVGATGQTNFDVFNLRYDFLMFHYAGSADTTAYEHVRDNGAATLRAGLNLSKFTRLDSLYLSTGMTYSYDQYRGVYDIKHYIGSLTEFYVQYKKIALRNTLYLGEGQVNMMGDKMYTAEFYDRTDFIWNVFKKGPVKAEVEFAVHFLPEVVDFSQKFCVYLEIGGRKKFKHPELIH